MQRIGVLGVGELTEKVVIGLRKGGFDGEIRLSPRNRERAEALAVSWQCHVMESNQEVVNASDLLFLGVRPDAVESVAREITVPSGLLLISLVAGMEAVELATLFTGAEVVRAMLSYASQINQSTVLLTPFSPNAESVLARLGTLVVLESEAEFEIATVTACMNGWFYFFLNDLQDWLIDKGISEDNALRLVTGNMQDCLAVIRDAPEKRLENLGKAIATPDTYTAAGLEVLRHRNSSAPWHEACELVLQKLINSHKKN
ncbi:NAD(P)-binding domain-containing protein [Pseudomonas syringae]|uniref:NAD(P)-binding domain-containing protein n=1 Tax=Pseudomonas syringae TaxID=317 RepID=UPI0018E64157|nr:NAD(P)-binding domain-containing protein [Pseudomonas syringae]MBI6753794.1 NAD(P)-binding domain-containing protein [Pseudomonas syringae]MBI6773298.1 NAD(P)-binding domain-containing protein [Pseudomonas syringae]MBI6779027.1 NAD(P)-binding domain-containing protein [Pseudomonas syringae]MBI6793751.1 NAD(P)-binding domain-containing protein [Pseudomonas syringae]MBI6804240.1 NAD(P)-binding domain-containing protein [Pseudomonas syringae]